jgi:GNAT superfamily N-acetyltransferase
MLAQEYWKNKTIMNSDKKYHKVKIIDKSEPQINNEETLLPTGFKWDKVELESEELVIVCNFLTQHCGTVGQYIIEYTPEYIRYIFNGHGYFMVVKNSKDIIIGTIGITFRTADFNGSYQSLVEPYFMCVHKDCRNKGIARVLMDEAVNQSARNHYNKGIFVDNEKGPAPIGRIRYYSRCLNYKFLNKNDFASIDGVDGEHVHNVNKIRQKPNKLYTLAEDTEENIKQVYDLYNKYTTSFSVRQILSQDEIKHYLFNNQFVKILLVKNDCDEVVDFISYTINDVTNTKKTKHNIIHTATIFMYSSNYVAPTTLFNNLLRHVNSEGIHIVYIPDMMESNNIILSNIKGGDEDTDEEDEKQTCDNFIMKTNKRKYINLYNLESPVYKQNNLSWLVFN